MANVASNRWIQLGVASIIAVAIGAVIGTSLLSSEGGEAEGSAALATPRENVMFVTGEGLVGLGDPLLVYGGTGAAEELDLVNLPLTAADAVAAGLKDPGKCSAGRGRYFSKGTAGEGDPFVLLYNKADDLIGVYHFDFNETPPPFVKTAGLTEAGVPSEHWGLFVYFVDPTNAC